MLIAQPAVINPDVTRRTSTRLWAWMHSQLHKYLVDISSRLLYAAEALEDHESVPTRGAKNTG